MHAYRRSRHWILPALLAAVLGTFQFHLARTGWIPEHGYRHLLRGGAPH